MSINPIYGVSGASNIQDIDNQRLSYLTNHTNPAFMSNPIGDELDIEQKPQKKVGFGEGLKIMATGFKDKVVGIAKSIIKHPLKTAAIVGGTCLALAALPVIGISSAVGAAALAVGFGAYAIGKTAVHAALAIKHNNNGEYDRVREDLHKIGGDTVDLALSVPFMPKGIKEIHNAVKFSPGLRINTELLSTVKNTKGFIPRLQQLSKADLQIMYKQHVAEMGIKGAPELKFVDMPIMMGGGFNPKTGELMVNAKYANPLTTNFMDGILRHELQHFKQYSDIARAQNVAVNGSQMSGIDALRQVSNERVARISEQAQFGREFLVESIEAIKKQPPKNAFQGWVNKVKLRELESQLKFMDAQNMTPGINDAFWTNVINNNGGAFKTGTAEASQAQKYLDAWTQYPDNLLLNMRSYLNNLLEVEARQVQKDLTHLRPSPSTVINQQLSDNAEVKPFKNL